MTTFKAALGICGLSQVEAADFLDVSISSVKNWSCGATQPPEIVWRKMAGLYVRILFKTEIGEGASLPGGGDAVVKAMGILVSAAYED